MNRLALKAFLIILAAAHCSFAHMAFAQPTRDIQMLMESLKIRSPNAIIEGLSKDGSKTRVIVNLGNKLKDGQTIQTIRNLKNLSARSQLQNQVISFQKQVINSMNINEVRITNRFTYIAGFSAEVTLQGLQDLVNHPNVISIEEDKILHAHLAQGISLLNASTIRNTYNGSGMAIAICDTGIDYNHPMLGDGGFPNDKVIGGYDTGEDDADPIDGNGHGTACAGIAAGSLGTTGDYIGGVAYSAKLYALKMTYNSTVGSAYTSDMIEAWEWCITHQNDDPSNPIMIISTSFGGGRYSDQTTCDNASTAMATAAANAKAVGITLFVSSGNDGYCDSMGWPGCLSDVISVGAVYDANIGRNPPAGYVGCIKNGSCVGTPGICSEKYYVDDPANADQVTTYSNTASFLTLFAPAEWTYTTELGGGYWDTANGFGGTSAACPYAAGAAASLQSKAKTRTGSYLTPDQVESYLTDYGDSITDGKVNITKPRINLENSIDAITSAPLLTTTAVSSITSTSATSGGNVTDDGGVAVTARGVCWSTSTNPTTDDSHTTDGTGSGSFTSIITGLSPGTTYHVRAYALNSVGTSYGSDLTFTTHVPIASGVDNDVLTWTTGGDADWYGQISDYYEDGDAAQSGSITHNQSSWVETTVTGHGELSFYWKVSSESDHDYLRFAIDSVEQSGSISGDLDWQQKTYLIGSESHTLRWTYSKDDSTSSGTDAGWLDKVVFTAASNNSPDKPTLSSPTDTAINIALNPTLQSANFSDPDFGDTHKKTQWQIMRRDNGLSVFDLTDTSHLTTLSVPTLILEEGTAYDWKVRFYDNNDAPSAWSDSYSFTTLTTGNDQNQNGIPDSQEVGSSVDLDSDGTPDAIQSDIKVVNTVVGSAQIGVSFKDSATVSAIKYIESIDPATISDTTNKPDNLPFGLINLRLTVNNYGDTARVTVYLSSAASSAAKWYKYDTIDGWQDYSAHVTFSTDRQSAVLELKDGGYGDADRVANGVIVDPSGVSGSSEPATPSTSSPTTSGGGGCFIATAAYGSRTAKEVEILRKFRDNVLLNKSIGKKIVGIYYQISPPLADLIADHDSLRTIIRTGLLPIVGLSWAILKLGPASTLSLMVLLGIGLFGFIRFRKTAGLRNVGERWF